ncbi:hypothetical protein G6F65_020347 [Rhizopus arrhizus]|nr:hypothetical protein G6F65_020347 [Rhizopus arrhizus]
MATASTECASVEIEPSDMAPRDGARRVEAELEQAARLAGAAPIDVLLFGGTSASFLHGTAYDQALIQKLRQWVPGPQITTASTATLAALKQVKAGKVALATPYLPEFHERAIRFLQENGHEVVKSACLGISDDHALAEVSLEKVYDHVISVDHSEATAIFVSNWVNR